MTEDRLKYIPYWTIVRRAFCKFVIVDPKFIQEPFRPRSGTVACLNLDLLQLIFLSRELYGDIQDNQKWEIPSKVEPLLEGDLLKIRNVITVFEGDEYKITVDIPVKYLKGRYH